jgi:tetratricopeptide (TPR) repeat protein
VILFWLGKFAEANSLLEESVAVYNDLGFASLAWSNTLLGITKAHLGQYEQARALGQISLTLYREIGDRAGIGHSLLALGHIVLATEAYAEARQLLRESVAVYQEIGQLGELCWALSDLGLAALRLGDISQAQQHLFEALRTSTEIRFCLTTMFALSTAALIRQDQGRKEQAVELYALASRYPLVGNSRWFEDVAGKHIAAVAAALPLEVVAAAQERGRTRDLEATVAELLAELEE